MIPSITNNIPNTFSSIPSETNIETNITKYIININVKHYETDTPSIFLNGMLEYYWIHKWKMIQSITTEKIFLNFKDKSNPLIVKRYLGQIASINLDKKYNLFSWGDILLEINVSNISAKNKILTTKQLTLAIAADDEYCQRNWTVFGDNILIKSLNENDSYYSNNSYYDPQLRNINFNCSTIPVIASQIYHPNLPKHITYLPLFIHHKLGKYNENFSQSFKAFEIRKYDYNALIGMSTGLRYLQSHFWNTLKSESVINNRSSIHLSGVLKPVLYQSILSQSKFTLCPSGNNPESYRLWEAIVFGSIPILAIDIEYFTHPCRNSYSFIIHYIFSLEYHKYSLKLNQTQCETMLICWSKHTAMKMLNKPMNSFVPVIVITEWNIVLYKKLLSDMLSMDREYWNKFQHKMMKWMQNMIANRFRRMLNNLLNYIDIKVNRDSQIAIDSGSHLITDFYNKSYEENLRTFLLKENRQITLLINTCYKYNMTLTQAVILSIFKYIDLNLIYKKLIIDNCGRDYRVIDILQKRYGNHFEIKVYGNDYINFNDLKAKDIVETINNSFQQIKTNWVLYVDYWEFYKSNFIRDSFNIYENILDEPTNIIKTVECNYRNQKVGLMPMFIYHIYVKYSMEMIWFNNGLQNRSKYCVRSI